MTPTRTRNQPERRAVPPPVESAVAVFDPDQAKRRLVDLVSNREEQLAALLGVDRSDQRGRQMLDRFVTVALHAATSDEKILRATPESVIEAIRNSAMLGLEPVGVTGDGTIVVYDEKVRREVPSPSGRGTISVEVRVPTARFQPMYRGLLKVSRRSQQIAHIDAHVVYQGDEIAIDLGSSPSVRHSPALDGESRGGYVGAYAVAELTNGRRYVDWMTLADVEAVRRTSRAKDDGPWVLFWPEMARKTVLRRLMKRLPLETLAEHALRLDAEVEERALPASPAPVPSGSEARARLRSRFGLADPAIPALGAPDPAGAPTSPPEPTETPEAGAPPVSVAPAGAEPPADVEEGVTRPADGTCGAEGDPKLGPAEPCVLPAGHLDAAKSPQRHQGASGAIWPAGGRR